MKRYLLLLIPVFLLSIVISATLATPAEAAPDSGFGAWSSEEAYLANPDTPETIYTNNDLALATGKLYIVCYGDVALNSQFEVHNMCDAVIDLNGYTLTTKSVIRIGSGSGFTPSSLTIKNGTINVRGSQFIKAQNNSSVIFDNTYIDVAKVSMFYSDGVRMVYFKDSVLDVTKSGSVNVIQIYPILPSPNSQIANYEKIPLKDFEYVHNIVFDNTYVKNEGFSGKLIDVPNGLSIGRDEAISHYEISFLPGSSIDVIDSHFLNFGNLNAGAYAKLNLSKGMKFKTREVPLFDDTDPILDINFYNSVEIDGMYAKVGDITEVEDSEDYEQVEGEVPKLIWGNSDDPDFPYQLCNYLYTVTWNVKGLEPEIVVGYADGAKLSHKVASRGYYVDETDNRIYRDIHVGWATSEEEDAEYSEYITVTGDMTYYAKFSGEGPATVVEFATSEMKVEDVVSIITTDTISGSDFAAFEEGAYVYLYEDVNLGITTGVNLNKTLTLDLGGKTLTRTGSVSDKVSAFNLNGSAVTVKNGKINLSMIGLATVDPLSTLCLMDVDVSFDNYPLINASGMLNLNGVNIVGLSDSTKVPAIALASDGSATVNVTDSTVDVNGPLFTHTGSESANVMDITLDAVDIKAGSVFYIFDISLDKINPATKLNIKLTDNTVDSDVVFNVPGRNDGTPALDAEFTVNSGTFSANPDTSECGKLTLPVGQSIVHVNNSFYTLLESSLEFKFNLSLEYGFTAYFYLPTSLELTDVTTYKDTFVADELAVEEIEGEEYYKVAVDGISPSSVLNDIVINVGFTDAERSCVAKVVYAPTSYFAKLLSSPDVLDLKLTAAAMSYIEAAYAYDSVKLPEAFVTLLDSDAYAENKRATDEIPASYEESDLGNISVAFTGAQLHLSSTLSVRFNLKESFSGTLNVGDSEYVVEAGRIGELTYIDYVLSPRDLYANKIEINGEGTDVAIAGEYSFGDYLASYGTGDTALADMLSALYAYCYEAFVYSNHGVIPPIVDNSPIVDVTYR